MSVTFETVVARGTPQTSAPMAATEVRSQGMVLGTHSAQTLISPGSTRKSL
jgi:hypothetical protein